ncbi:MAG: cytochrome c oxidase subunit II [Bauldia sp.]|nr:cytochrome c oxidase subunit II [Bauldia sp.]
MSPPISSRCARAAAVVGAAAALAACDGPQAALDPAGPDAEAISTIAWVMFGGAAIVFIVVLVAVAWALRARRAREGRGLIIAGGVVFPLVVLTALLVFGLTVSSRINAEPDDALTIRVTGKQWWWQVDYLDAGEPVLTTANDIVVPVGAPVRFVLTTDDVIHSFWVPSLGGKLDMIPGRINETVLQADVAGAYRGQCAEFCGDQHALMAFTVAATDDFAAWLAAQQRPAAEPVTDLEARGAALFLENGCGACHTIRGTDADGTIGPDLTHVGGRPTIAAGTLPNNQGTLAGWIADAQAIKPGARMPSFDRLAGPELRALAAYLASLE